MGAMNAVFLGARVVHVLGATLWLGAIFFISMYLMPVLQQAGPEGGKIMAGLERRGLVIFMSSVAGFTILTGFYLYWHLTGGFDPAMSGSHEAMVFGAGGVLGLIAGIIGGSVVGRSAKKASMLSAKMASLSEKDRAAVVAEIQQLRQKMVTWGHVVVVLLVITVVLMTIGHYV
jgi:uncharacterized membrane protein